MSKILSFFVFIFFFFFKQKTAYEIYQCDWSSDVCSSDLGLGADTDSFQIDGVGGEDGVYVRGEAL